MIEIRNQFGQIDLAAIDPPAVSALSDLQQAKLAALIGTVEEREAATERFNKAVRAVRAATQEQIDAQAAHVAANPPMTFQQAQQSAIEAFNKSNR